MSMFHELMMRKKEETLYPVIKGSLTESPEGVFSGFSSSDYLEVQDGLDLTKSWEFQITFTTGNDISTEQFILTDTQTPSPIGFGIFTNSQFVVYYMNTQGTRVYTFINGLSANTKYKVNLKYNRDEYKFYVYIDGVQKAAISSIYPFSNRKIRFGVSRTFTSVFAGSIDLPNSYIKIGATKYNLQAVVGYTIVGSPTIVDGVVSGFNSTASGGASNDYITLPNFTLNADDDFEFVCRGNYERVSYSQYFFYSQHFGIYHSGTNTLQFIVVDSGGANKYLNGDFTPSGDFVYVRITKVGNRYTTFASNDGKIWTQLNTSTTITPATTRTSTNNRFGTSSGGYSLFTGEIDLNNTYIKINNKLWFNGQQA